ncbi:hypothetical protein DVR12_13460 [Chitinophaga silvatica]|uniref:SMI1/KNR4 family protein n=1 Tax=Chitinophaga silvatica TaxID=2282649 RepID=A0A3E1YBD4_9BACT|nr:SUKH-4 family immunity protein [Chitinophaga silvatica]RFS22791.1 hypothetical protein DVR12_13460 [Chitinophaga silvatica]
MHFDKQSFINDWHSRFGEERFCFTEETLSGFNLPSVESDFLKEMGLPRAIAPFLFFAGDRNDQNASLRIDYLHTILPTVSYHGKSIVIGSDGVGSFVVLDPTKEFAVILLENDVVYKPIYMNSSLWQMARCLLTYCDFIKTINRENGDDAWMDYYCNNEQLASINEALAAIDPTCVEKGFWKQELDLFRNNIN